jgi:hypothetical protein
MLKALCILLPGSLLSVSALAMVAPVKGDTTCTLVTALLERQAVEKPCEFEGVSGASMVYYVKEITFTLPKGKTVDTVNNATFRFDEEGEMQDLEEEVLLDNQPAKVIHINSRTLRPISPQQLNKQHEAKAPDYSEVLHCLKPIKKDSAFCIPYELMMSIS